LVPTELFQFSEFKPGQERSFELRDLTDEYLPNAALEAVFKSIILNQQNVVGIKMVNCCIDQKKALLLKNSFSSDNFKIRNLDLSDNPLEDKGATSIITGLIKNDGCDLRVLTLRNTILTT